MLFRSLGLQDALVQGRRRKATLKSPATGLQRIRQASRYIRSLAKSGSRGSTNTSSTTIQRTRNHATSRTTNTAFSGQQHGGSHPSNFSGRGTTIPSSTRPDVHDPTRKTFEKRREITNSTGKPSSYGTTSHSRILERGRNRDKLQ